MSPDSPWPSQQLMMTGVAYAEEIEDSTLDHLASPASKAFSKSRPRRVRRLMSLVLPSGGPKLPDSPKLPAHMQQSYMTHMCDIHVHML